MDGDSSNGEWCLAEVETAMEAVGQHRLSGGGNGGCYRTLKFETDGGG
jgi:hypothetical protein